MDGECDRQAKQKNKTQPLEKQQRIENLARKKSIYFWFRDFFFL